MNQKYSFKKLFIQIVKTISAWENSEKHAKWAIFPSKRTFYSFFLWILHFLIHSKIHPIVRQKYSFKEFIHSIVRQNIHSKNLFIQKIIWLFNQWKYSFFEKCRIGHPYPHAEAQKPKTFRIASFYAQKFSGRSARIHFSRHIKKARNFLLRHIKKARNPLSRHIKCV